MKKLMVSTLALCALTAAAWPSVHAAGTKGAEREWVTQKLIDAKGGVKLAVDKLGTFRIKSVRSATATHKECLVHVPSVRALIAKGVSEGTLDFSGTNAVRVELKVTTCPKGLTAGGVLHSEDTDGSGGSGNGGGDDDDDDEEEELCCKGGGKGCVADIERLP